MSGHSKWAKLKHSQGAVDAKKSAMFTKVGHMITIAVREAGGDPETNFKLRLAIEKARQVNMSKDNVERAINRGLGKTGEAQIEEAIFEVFLPGGAALVIEALTDNRNRTVASLRRIFNKSGGSLAGQNAVLWMFERRGIVRISRLRPAFSASWRIRSGRQGSGGQANFKQINNLEDFQLKMIDSGAEDIKEEGEELVIYTKIEDLQKVKELIEKEGIQVDYAEVEWFAKNTVRISSEDQKKVDVIYAELDEEPDVSDYYSNIK